ncbi:hypothetical protein GF312_10170 [Candidatus Poribacteria bacterium]|nr:hypothetical protein [Candidatus Poribacteria bacterium]
MESSINNEELDKLLKHINQKEISPDQKEIINAVLSGSDVLVTSNHRFDTSVLYKIPALIFPGITLVVSESNETTLDSNDPLLPSTCINRNISHEYLQQRIKGIAEGKYKLIFTSPDMFKNSEFLFALDKIPVYLMVIEKAQYISRFYRYFRPEYFYISKALIESDPPPVTMALADTCIPRIQDNICYQLQIDQAKRFKPYIGLNNLHLSLVRVSTMEEKLRILSSLIYDLDGPGVIYAGSRKDAEVIYRFLAKVKSNVMAYHNMINQEKRSEIKKHFENTPSPVIIINHFSDLKITRKDIRLIVHFYMPLCPDTYLHQISGAGIDGKPARCVLIFCYSDRDLCRSGLKASFISSVEFDNVKKFLSSYPRDQAVMIPFRLIEDRTATKIYRILDILSLMERCGMLRLLPDFPLECRIRLKDNAKSVEEKSPVLKWLLENDNNNGDSNINLARLSDELSCSMHYIEESLNQLHFEGLLSLRYRRKTIAIHIMNLNKSFPDSIMAEVKKIKSGSLKAMEGYIDTSECRHEYLMNYMDLDIRDCFGCDNCENKKKDTDTSLIKKDYAIKVEDIEYDDIFAAVLRCAYKANGQVSRRSLLKILKGQKTRKIGRYRLDSIEEYGILANMSEKSILNLIDEMIERGCLIVSGIFYPSVQITELGHNRLKRIQKKHS